MQCCRSKAIPPQMTKPHNVFAAAQHMVCFLLADGLDMHEIAVAPTIARVLLVLSASGFPKVCHWRKFCIDWSACIVASLQSLKSLCCSLLVSELHIHIAYHVISKVVAHIQVLKFTVLSQLLKNILVKVLQAGKEQL
jgi:hypothetical protein